MKVRSTLALVLTLSGSGMAIAATAQTAAAAAVDVPHPTLTDAQKQALKAIDEEAKKKAAPLALQLGEVAKKVYTNMLADPPDPELRTKLAGEMRETVWALLSIKGDSIWQSVAVLTPEQKRLLKAEMAKPGAPADLSEVIGHLFHLSDPSP